MELPNINKKKIIKLLSEGKRIDSRNPSDYREISIETDVSNKAEGSARVRIGKTEVIVGVKLDVVTPYADHPDEGTLMVGMEFSPICGERYEVGPPKINAIELSRVVDRGVRESKFIDFKKLCIKEEEKVWSIMIDVYCINDDGNVIDASSLGVVAALQLSKLPIYDEENDQVKYGELSETPIPLTKNIPLAMTFYKVGNNILFDPTRDEEDASEARITMAITSPDKDKIINSMQKGGITPISIEEMNTIIEEAEKIYDKLFPEVEKMVENLK
ncbi:RNA-binding protein [Candidatus Pacearchaeota archaeon]|nr:RNA-binding protein [Candidatus Pacearchaeota archaeon]